MSHTFCSISADRTLKVWDLPQKAYLETLYGHKAEGLTMDFLSKENFVSGGIDKSIIVWKTENQSQLIYEDGHDYAVDIVKGIDSDHFLSASQDGSVALWSTKKKTPLIKIQEAHGGKWVTAMGNQYQTDVFATGSYDDSVCVYKLDLEHRKYIQLFKLPHEGITTDIKFSTDCSLLAIASGDSHRLGRWFSSKSRTCIKIFKF